MFDFTTAAVYGSLKHLNQTNKNVDSEGYTLITDKYELLSAVQSRKKIRVTDPKLCSALKVVNKTKNVDNEVELNAACAAIGIEFLYLVGILAILGATLYAIKKDYRISVKHGETEVLLDPK